MKGPLTIIFLLTFVLTLYNCSSTKILTRPCCGIIYPTIKSAINCIKSSPPQNTTADSRLILLVFNKKQNNQPLDSIFKNPKIINEIKKNYLVVFVSQSQKDELIKNSTFGLDKFIKEFPQTTNFYVTISDNFHPWWSWDENTSKEEILINLEVGAGP